MTWISITQMGNHQLFACIIRIICKMCGVLITRNNKNTRSGHEQIVLYTEVPTPFYFISGASENSGFDRSIQSFESGKDEKLIPYIEDTFPLKAESRVIDLHTWLSEHVVPGSGYVTTQDIHKSIETKGLAFSRNNVYNENKNYLTLCIVKL